MTTETYQCDACAEIVPRSQVKSGIPSAGVEGTFCAKCRGVDPDEDEAPDSDDFEAKFWRQLIECRGEPDRVVVNGTHYIIGVESASIPKKARGFNGDRYNIKFFDGLTIVSTNMWCQGTIPAAFRDQLPDNAEFVKG